MSNIGIWDFDFCQEHGNYSYQIGGKNECPACKVDKLIRDNAVLMDVLREIADLTTHSQYRMPDETKINEGVVYSRALAAIAAVEVK